MSDDPLARLEEFVRKDGLEEDARKALARARIRMIMGRDARSVFFATLALRLRLEADWSCPTMMTDGRRLCYNPEWVMALAQEERVGVVAHEVMHNALAHHTRRGHRDMPNWNIACDLAINPLLLQAGYDLPRDRRVPGEGQHRDLPVGKSAEEYYELLRKPGQGGDQGQDPGGCGGVQDAGDGSPAAQRESQAQWELAVAQAHQAAKQRGVLPGALDRLVQSVLAPRVDWRAVLREFVSRQSRNDYSFFPPNRRFIHLGLYLPGMRSEELGDVVVAVDTSGSISDAQIQRFAGEVQGILESFDCTLTILYCDARVQHVQRWTSTEGPLILEPRGGGGTDHRPVFAWIREHHLDPTCLVALTDLETCFPDHAPDYPVLWASTSQGVRAPFGTTLEVQL